MLAIVLNAVGKRIGGRQQRNVSRESERYLGVHLREQRPAHRHGVDVRSAETAIPVATKMVSA